MTCEIARMYGEKESSIHEVVKRRGEIQASLAASPPPVRVMVAVHRTCSGGEDMDRKHGVTGTSMLHQKAWHYDEDVNTGSLKQ